MPSRTAYNQLELFTDSFPGNAYAFNPDYDLYLTLSDAALCFFFKEHLKESEDHAPDHILHRPAGTTRLHRHHRQGGQGEDDRQRQFLLHRALRGSGKSFHMYSTWRKTGQNDGKRLQNLLL